ncbi:MAG: RNA 2',3'-cyclic phosphodiesterase [Burkholderiales bacterium]
MKYGDGAARLFLALWPDETTREELARCRDAWAWSVDARPVPSEQLHVTLHFLGAVPRARLPELTSKLRAPLHPFALRLGRAQRWPNGIAALTPTAVPPELLALHAALQGCLSDLGLRTESRRFKPHVTLARNARNSIASTLEQAVDWKVDRYVLVESRGDGGYTVLQSYP